VDRASPNLKAFIGAIAWRSTKHEGIQWYPLAPERDPRRSVPRDGPERERVEGDDSVVLIRMDPGCGYPPHRHVGIEDVLVLEGGYRDDRGEHRAGTYLRYPAGSAHAPVAIGDRGKPIGEQNPSCILFAIARSGVESL
jgi:ChrR Cupin-like domain